MPSNNTTQLLDGITQDRNLTSLLMKKEGRPNVQNILNNTAHNNNYLIHKSEESNTVGMTMMTAGVLDEAKYSKHSDIMHSPVQINASLLSKATNKLALADASTNPQKNIEKPVSELKVRA